MGIEATHEGGIQIQYSPLGHQQISVGASAVGLPSLPPKRRVRRVTIRPVDQPICFRDDGIDPTGTTGMILFAGDALVYDGDPEAFRMISAASAIGAADVRIAYYGT